MKLRGKEKQKKRLDGRKEFNRYTEGVRQYLKNELNKKKKTDKDYPEHEYHIRMKLSLFTMLIAKYGYPRSIHADGFKFLKRDWEMVLKGEYNEDSHLTKQINSINEETIKEK